MMRELVEHRLSRARSATRSSATISAPARPRQIAIDGMRSFLLARGPARPRRATRPPRVGGRRVHRVRRRPPPVGRVSRHAAAPWASAAPTGTAPRTSSCTGRAASTSSSTSRTRASPHSFQLLHGLSVAALALRVDDAAGAVAACHARCSPSRSPGPIGEGELAIPAVRGVGGSLLYFVGGPAEHAPFHEVDFVADAAAGAAPISACSRSTTWPRSCRRPSS